MGIGRAWGCQGMLIASAGVLEGAGTRELGEGLVVSVFR